MNDRRVLTTPDLKGLFDLKFALVAKLSDLCHSRAEDLKGLFDNRALHAAR